MDLVEAFSFYNALESLDDTAWKITRLPTPFLFATGVKGGSRKTSMRNRKWKSGRFVSLRLLWWKPLNKQYELFYINSEGFIALPIIYLVRLDELRLKKSFYRLFQANVCQS